MFRHGSSISEDCRIGSNAFVSHAVQLGKRVFVGHGAVVNGNVTVGADSWIGPGAIVSQNLQIGDKALARSIWTHAAKPQIETTLDAFLRDAAPEAIFLASYLPAASPEEDYQGLQWVGTSHESDTPGVICHALPWILCQCRERGLSCEEIPGLDCDSQLWLRIRRSQTHQSAIRSTR